jgi:rod shape determining protein RodA
MPKILNKLKRFDILITSSFLLLIIINFVHIYSSIQITGFLYDTGPKIYTQIYYSILAILLYCSISFFDYRWLKYKFTNLILFALSVMSLLLVFINPEIANVHRWITFWNIQIQPSEFVKIFIIVCVSSIFAYYNSAQLFVKKSFFQQIKNDSKPILYSALICSIPIFLILIQPSGGIALILTITLLLMILLFNKNSKLLIFGLIGFLEGLFFGYNLNLALIILVVTVTGGLIYFIYKKYALIFSSLFIVGLITIPSFNILWHSELIQPYQRDRLNSFINADQTDELKYQQNRAINLIQGVGLFGKGYLYGEKNYTKSTPEKESDFAYSVFIEENGIVGPFFYQLILIILILRAFYIKKITEDIFGKYLIIGIVLLIFNTFIFSTLINLNKIFNSGIPTPFLSSGGSALLANTILIGIINSIIINKNSLTAKL